MKLSEKTKSSSISTLILLLTSVLLIGWSLPDQSKLSAKYYQIIGLVARWEMDEGSGTIAQDSSGNGNHGAILNGATWVAGKKGSALQFDGVDDYVDIGTLPGGNSFTMEAWVKTSDTIGWRYVIGNHPLSNGSFLAINTPGNHVRFSLDLGGEKFVDTIGVIPANGQWHHIAGVYDGSTAKIYFDCTLNNTRTGLSGTHPSFSAAIGKELHGGGNVFLGEIDEVAVYNRALSANELKDRCFSRLTLTKQVTPANPFPGERITYTLTVSNSGATATSTVVSDTLPAGLTFAGPVSMTPPQAGATLATTVGDLPTLANGLTITSNTLITLTFPVTINTGLPAGTIITNTASITSTTSPTPTLASAAVTIAALPTPNLGLTKQVNTPSVNPGERITYTLTVSNSGATTTGGVISDTLPPSLTLAGPVSLIPPQPGATLATTAGDLPSLARGLTITSNTLITLTFPVTVERTISTTTLITNTASVTSSTSLTPTFASTTLIVSPLPPRLPPNLGIDLTVDDPSPNPGQRLLYTITLSNSGATAFNGLLSNTLPPELIFAGPVVVNPAPATAPVAISRATLHTLVSGLTISQGHTIIVTLPVTLSTQAAIGVPITNTVSISSQNALVPVSSFVVISPVARPSEEPPALPESPQPDDDDDGDTSHTGQPLPTATPASNQTIEPVKVLPDTGYEEVSLISREGYLYFLPIGLLGLLFWLRWLHLRGAKN